MLDPGAEDRLGTVHVSLVVLRRAPVERAVVVRVVAHLMAGAAPRVEHFLQRLGPFDRPGARERIDLFDAAVGEGVNELTGDLLRRGALGER